jgi:hypothetical protein
VNHAQDARATFKLHHYTWFCNHFHSRIFRLWYPKRSMHPLCYGIGDFGDKARAFVDFLAASGQRLWQVLPHHYTGDVTV